MLMRTSKRHRAVWIQARRTATAASLGVLLLNGACGQGGRGGASGAAGDGETLEASTTLAWRPCVAPGLTTEAACVDFEVPEGPEGGTVSLFVMKIASDGNAREPDPVVLLAGGPGQSGSLTYPGFAESLRRALPSRDLVIVDQRGTGRSSALACDLDDDFGAQTKVEFDMDGLEACAKSWPHDPKNFTTEAAAGDLEALREAMGAPQLNLLGGSYGTRLALVYARLYEPHVRTMVLDGVAPPTMALPSSFAEDGQAALDRLFDDCRDAPGCAAQFPDLRSLFSEALRQNGQQQAPVIFVHPRTGEAIEVPLTETVFASGVRGLLYSPGLSALLPMIIAAAAEGDFVPFLNALVALGDPPEPMMDLGLMLSVLCAEDLPRIDPAAYEERWNQTFLKSSMYDLFASGCDRWPVEAVPASATAAVEVSTPTLLLSGALDPVTPARWAEEAARTLDASTHLVVEGSGHGTLSNPCVTQIAAEFIETREVSDESKECLAGLRRPPFFVDAKGPAH